ncbi:hypothetical protein [Orbus hercynius]|nr:hypothetical protein [Orbus hercynius]
MTNKNQAKHKKGAISVFFNACGVVSVYGLLCFTIYQMMVVATN